MLLTLAAAATALVSLPRAPLATLPVPRAAVSMNADSWENELRQGLRAAQSNGIAFGKARPVLGSVEGAWVLLFNAQQPDEGVYTLQGGAGFATGRAGAGPGRRTYLVGFSEKDDAESFVALLEAETFDVASPSLWSSPQLQQFCDAANFDLALVPAGAMLFPPSQNVYDHAAFEEAGLGPPPGSRIGMEGPPRSPEWSAEERARKRSRRESEEAARLEKLRQQLEARWEGEDA
ncbi:hypothetical protein EMIHUDRAFT_423219 [Emiliania huxleyi CCMP1516]|uniref:Uncharacterized protein n=2 Tax=Emiliania huxleyi TaxID=2903 RepID=A0A0D3JGM4_EMIH1|nr:hypothetical protein EMIHUDRAFT_444216 [Emiliania huxleyi CCMP1516]XP_005789962.1 hypothetical protein EMIHUDRAFT_423219 [Emiliania huxleyi CCMP1516]EOD22659.1 hypothetical protein EMIHUDRAFT_444216 [Emiliania huxleyi CCMP1516]EOD37533.1 hypothetical protein EMIHUDRAFT_423219 [Emiliania huxleyi CCMP1516]|eukprot:XP_005775088.1 hypothetical protein EMIHUDRAFT_444216 [Emiliania huxleyi CCMP1516]